MGRVVIAISLVLILLCSIIISVAAVLGTQMPMQLVTTVATHRTLRSRPRMMVQFHDLRRALSVSFLPRTDDRIINIMLDDPHHAFLLTQSLPTPFGSVTNQLFYVDLRSRDAASTSLASFPDVSPRDVFSVDMLAPKWSPDGTQLAYYRPLKARVYVYDTQNGQSHVVSEDIVSEVFRGSLEWSPDSSQIALREAVDRLMVVNADGSNLRHHDLPGTQTFEPMWSTDNQRILIAHFNQEDSPITVLDAETMQIDESIAATWGNYPRWCDDRYIMFFRVKANANRTPYVLDTQSGVVHNLTDHRLLTEGTLWAMNFDSTCEHLLLVRPSLAPLFYALYVSDMTGSDVQFVDDRVRIYSEEDGAITFFAPLGDDAYEVYQTGMDNLNHKERLAHFRPADQLNSMAFQATWNDSAAFGLLYVPGILYQIGQEGLRRISAPGDDVIQYAAWPGN